ncbi:MAG: PAS domain S-box protein [Archangium sp.]|nr:PAS domain S-box protein [Archangium sp.]
MHSLLERQLRRFFRGDSPTDPRTVQLLAAISDAYQAFDDDRKLLERTLALASQETEERYRALQQDIAARQRAESERDAFFLASPDLLAIFDTNLRIIQANPSWAHTLGHEPSELVGVAFDTLVHPDDLSTALAGAKSVTETGHVRDIELRLRHRDGSWRLVNTAGTMDTKRGLLFAIARDVTEQRQMERELAQAQKLEAVGQLASGVAHEINTPVQYVGDNVSFSSDGFQTLFTYLDKVHALLTPEQKKQLEDAAEEADLDYLKAEIPPSLSEAKDGLRRVAELVRALKEFAHPDAGEKAPADLNRALERALVLARGELKHVSRIETALGSIPLLRCHVGGLSQAFLNLFVNAAHAVEERTRVSGVSWKEHVIRATTRVEGGDAVIAISDTGCGIPDAIRDRIFEPFFTTKPMGKGSGQGLPLVRNVVMAHGGRIEIQSKVGEGTTFILRLPFETPSGIREAA